MTFDEILARVLERLQRQGRVSYQAPKRRFDLDDDYLEDVKAELIKAQRLAVDEAGEVPFRYATSKWLATGTSWSVGQRADLVTLRQPVSIQAGGAPWRLSLPGGGSLRP